MTTNSIKLIILNKIKTHTLVILSSITHFTYDDINHVNNDLKSNKNTQNEAYRFETTNS